MAVPRPLGKSHKAGNTAACGQKCCNHAGSAGVSTAHASQQGEPKTSSADKAAGACESGSAASYRPLQWQWLLGLLFIGWLGLICVKHNWAVMLSVGAVCWLLWHTRGVFAQELFYVSAWLQPLFRVNCRMHGHKVVALVDSGASVSFISRRWLRETGLSDRVVRWRDQDVLDVRFADGRVQHATHGLEGVYFTLLNPYTKQQARFRHTFVVIDMQPDLVLGFDWLVSVNPQIDWAKGAMTVVGRRSERNPAKAPPVVIPVIRVGRIARQQHTTRLPTSKPEVLLSTLQVKRLLRKRETAAWLAYMTSTGLAGPKTRGVV